jgi:hypothetical protein
MIAEDDEPASAMPQPTVARSSNARQSPPISVVPRCDTVPPIEEEDVTTAFNMDVDETPSEYPAIRSLSPQDVLPSVAPAVPSEPAHSSDLSTLTDLIVPTSGVDTDADSALSRKQSISRFPSIPQPSPLRKSTFRGASGGPPPASSAAVPSALNVGAPVNKRTSWLAKAREAKAAKVAEAHSKLAGAAGPSGSHLSTAPLMSHLKRKSDDISGLGPPETTPEPSVDSDRKLKISKTYHELAAEAMELDIPIQRAATYHEDLAEAATPTPMDLLRKTVEGMGPKSGKAPLKSTGGVAAAAELAKARAAAEARVAGRDATEVEHRSLRPSLSEPALPLLTLVQPSSSEAGPSAPPPHRTDNDRRLSISDLMPTNKARIPSSGLRPPREADLSASTTPPGSPRDLARMPPPPVFNKPPADLARPPVFTSDRPAVGSSGLLGDFSFKLPTSSAYSLRPIGLGLQPFSKPSSQTESGSSSQSTAFADPIFEPRTAESTQDSVYTSQESQYKYIELEEPIAAGAPVGDDDDSWGLDEKIATTDQQWTPFAAGTPAFEEHTDTWSGDGVAAATRTNAFGFPYANSSTSTWSTTHSSQPREGDSGRLTRSIPVAAASKPGAGPALEDAQFDDQHFENTEDIAELFRPASGKVWPKFLPKRNALSWIFRPRKRISSPYAARAKCQWPRPATNRSLQVSSGRRRSLSQACSASVLPARRRIRARSRAFRWPPSLLRRCADLIDLRSVQPITISLQQHEEQDKKNARLKEMEARRQATMQRKAEDDRLKAEEDDRKTKEETERRKKELANKRLPKPQALEKKVRPLSFYSPSFMSTHSPAALSESRRRASQARSKGEETGGTSSEDREAQPRARSQG